MRAMSVTWIPKWLNAIAGVVMLTSRSLWGTTALSTSASPPSCRRGYHLGQEGATTTAGRPWRDPRGGVTSFGRAVMSMRYDAIIIGAGHNGLVTAAYLARAGRRVLVLERRELVGGACVTEEVWPGFKVSTAAYVTSLLRPEIIRDLALDRHGLELLPRSPSSFTPFPDGRHLLMGPDREMTRREVAKFSSRDADALPRYEAMLERVAAFIEPTLLMTPPDPWSRSPRHLLSLARLGLRFVKLGKDGVHAVEILTGAARRLP